MQLETLMTFTAGNVFAGSSLGSLSSIGTISSVSSSFPEVRRNSGDIVYLENRGAVARAMTRLRI